ncbi:SpoIID/LytB domain-containing protein [Anaerobacillus sp. CMMVII]|uniref:SpoIID/LytB domain-containing protein n=1 Tax=Anaerobacillus sp. CMMVII TaxID=2755588 RepID=UPI0021B73520|nr:SpoIID/LytB domain-containing protein [Anaerobacillus sp. CMMVII]MCT8137947.1 SpoIID/LytB domain-containing protein [Anaerobacillus sp. CMMVII]
MKNKYVARGHHTCMKNFLIIFVCILAIVFPKGVLADEQVSVRLVNYIGNTEKVNIKCVGEYHSLDSTLLLKEGATYQLKVKDGEIVLDGDEFEYITDGSLVLLPKSYDEENVIYINDRPYLGSMELQIEDETFIRPVNQLLLEDYLKGVVPFEVYPTWDLETLKAQTLAARTYAVTNLKKKMDDTIRFQVYGGYTWNDHTTQAVEETRGEVITYRNQLIDAFYSASNGGLTESNAHVWGGNALTYFPIQKDPYDPIHPWEFQLNKHQISLNEIDFEDRNWWVNHDELDTDITMVMKKWLHKKGYSKEIKILSIPHFEIKLKNLHSDRADEGTITVEFLQRLLDGTVLYHVLVLENGRLDRIRPMIGGDIFRSYLVDSFIQNDDIYIVKGRGYGHGVGMSQWGAQKMAERGKKYQEILQFYYPGTRIKKM